MGEYTILEGRVEEILPSLFAEGDFDACLCDPPYLLEFMGKEFDKQHKKMPGANDGQRMQAWHEGWTREVLRVLKPGAHMLAFGGTRTYHRLASAVENVGFEVRDMVTWLYGQGFPKNRHTQLKPAVEPCLLAKNIGRGTLNIDECRIGTTGGKGVVIAQLDRQDKHGMGWGTRNVVEDDTVRGRWPANLLLSHHPDCIETDRTITPPRNGSIRSSTAAASASRTGPNAYSPDDRPRGEWEAYQDVVRVWACHPDCPVRMLDEQSGVLKSPAPYRRATGSNKQGIYSSIRSRDGEINQSYGDKGGASRFFYTAKVSPRERHLGGIDCRHPTLKPISLCTYLATLLLPPPSTSPRRILIPFSGAGSEVIGALRAGWDEVYGIEQDEEYNMWAESRIPAALELEGGNT